MDPKIWLAIAVLFVMGWFAVGVIFNLRRGDAMIKWLRQALPRVGERSTFRWLGTSVAELVIGQARNPFRRLETLIVLSPRDVPWLWLWAFSRGRRDTLIFRATLVNAPRVDLELVDPSSWTGRMGVGQAARQGWESQEIDGMQLLAPPGTLTAAKAALACVNEPARRLSNRYYRFSLHRDAPHLEVHMPLPDRTTAPEQFIAGLQELARSAGEEANLHSE
jgi:hypothetical protein